MAPFQNFCCFIFVILFLWIFGAGNIISFFVKIFPFFYNIIENIILYLIACIAVVLMNFTGILYTAWVVIVLILNISLIVFQFYYWAPNNTFNNKKTPEIFFKNLALTLILPQLTNYILINDIIRINLLLPFHLTFFLNSLYPY
jgi:hypothetical protein